MRKRCLRHETWSSNINALHGGARHLHSFIETKEVSDRTPEEFVAQRPAVPHVLTLAFVDGYLFRLFWFLSSSLVDTHISSIKKNPTMIHLLK